MRTTLLRIAAAIVTISCGSAPPPDQSGAVAELRGELATQNARIMRLEEAAAAKVAVRPTTRRRATPRATAPATSSAPQPFYQAPAPTRSVTRGFIRGPRGGCYTYSTSGRKQYVNRAICN